jgi:hypothetical protein
MPDLSLFQCNIRLLFTTRIVRLFCYRFLSVVLALNLAQAGLFSPINRGVINVSEQPILRNCLRNLMQNGKNNAKLKKGPPKFPPALGENDGKIFRH